MCALILLAWLVLPVAVLAQGPGVFALRTMLQDKTPEIRMKAAEGLGRIGGHQGIIILRQGLLDLRHHRPALWKGNVRKWQNG